MAGCSAATKRKALEPAFSFSMPAHLTPLPACVSVPAIQVHVWERPCAGCNGSGYARSSRRKGYGATSVCMLCQGIGYVRCSSTRIMPDVGGRNGDVAGWGRPAKGDQLDSGGGGGGGSPML